MIALIVVAASAALGLMLTQGGGGGGGEDVGRASQPEREPPSKTTESPVNDNDNNSGDGDGDGATPPPSPVRSSSIDATSAPTNKDTLSPTTLSPTFAPTAPAWPVDESFAWDRVGDDVTGLFDGERLGWSLAVGGGEDDGARLAVGGHRTLRVHALSARGADGARVWTPTADLSALVANFCAVALSSDGGTLIVGDPFRGADDAGAAFSLRWTATTGGGGGGEATPDEWAPVGGGALSGTAARDYFGVAVAASDDGRRIVVGSSPRYRGYARVYDLSEDDDAWGLASDLRGTADGDRFGAALAMDGTGATLAVGAYGARELRGEVRVYDVERAVDDADAVQTLSGTEPHEHLGRSVALSGDGDTLVAAAWSGGDGDDDDVIEYARLWRRRAIDDDADADSSDRRRRFRRVHRDLRHSRGPHHPVAFGSSLSLSNDGTRLAVGSFGADGARGEVVVFSATADDDDNDDVDAHVAVDAIGTFVGDAEGDRFGVAVALSGDGRRVVVGGHGHEGCALLCNDRGVVRVRETDR